MENYVDFLLTKGLVIYRLIHSFLNFFFSKLFSFHSSLVLILECNIQLFPKYQFLFFYFVSYNEVKWCAELFLKKKIKKPKCCQLYYLVIQTIIYNNYTFIYNVKHKLTFVWTLLYNSVIILWIWITKLYRWYFLTKEQSLRIWFYLFSVALI